MIVEDSVKRRLGQVMGARWQEDLLHDGLDPLRVEKVVTKSQQRIARAGALVMISLVKGDLQRYPDDRRQAAEYTMGAHSVGAAIQNILLAAHTAGLAGSWMCAPLFCPEDVCQSLALPTTWSPQALILLGYPAEKPKDRVAAPLDRLASWIDS